MKPLLLTAFALLFAGSTYAQYYEVGLGGGLGTVGTPSGLPTQYQGSSGSWNGMASAGYNYNINDYWQIGGTIDMSNWKRTGTWNVNGSSTSTNVDFILANPAIAFCVRGNRVIPFYSPINPEMVQSQIYFGVSAGMMFTANDGKTFTGSDSYVKQFDLENGKGYIIGIQAGYAYYFRRHLGVFGEIAPRYVNIMASDARYGHELEKYHLINFNVTVGVRYRFGFY